MVHSLIIFTCVCYPFLSFFLLFFIPSPSYVTYTHTFIGLTGYTIYIYFVCLAHVSKQRALHINNTKTRLMLQKSVISGLHIYNNDNIHCVLYISSFFFFYVYPVWCLATRELHGVVWTNPYLLHFLLKHSVWKKNNIFNNTRLKKEILILLLFYT